MNNAPALRLSEAGFTQATLPSRLGDYPDWHQGRERYGVWLMEIDSPALLAYITDVRQALADLLHPQYQRQPHITLFVCGFEQPEKRLSDDFTAQALRVQCDSLQRLAPSSFELQASHLDSFASAAFIALEDPQASLAPLRQALSQGSEEIRYASYVPHLTLGLYRQSIDAQALRQRLAALPAPPSAPLRITRLLYCTYCAQEQFGPLSERYRMELADAVAPPPRTRQEPVKTPHQ
ncbi:2'-5' RNA ligase family protein [Pseudomonas sp. ABC1]|uniref:2'-5' RNA ligase family protein n=1 Tax=Pseudomonas sp. ABC1 TaxID=2748080 RepID=UPI0015C37A74|nr:2'-5' RNA ligase family protein [Pseudomonas sp. ABC1]QLF92910.1 2'-5' RNA ligase family protein [Pseudomonas sp. ABC1]